MGKDYYDTQERDEVPPMFSIKNVGSTEWIGPNYRDPIQAVTAHIRKGASSIELTAPGTQRGNPQNPTFEMFDQTQRRELREMIRASNIEITTHASPAVMLSGLSRNGFSEQQRQNSIEEIKKAIDFSADATSGGSVVVHTGEFPRTIGSNSIRGWNKDGDKYQFESYKDEAKEAAYYLVDNDTGQIIKGIKEDETIFKPIEEKVNGKTKFLTDPDGNYVYDDVIKKSILIRNESAKGDWSKVPEEEKEGARIPVYKTDQHGNIEVETIEFNEFKKNVEQELKPKGKNPEQILKESLKRFYKEQTYAQVQQALGTAREFEQEYTDGLKDREKLQRDYEFYQMLKKNLSGEELNTAVAQLKRQVASRSLRHKVDLDDENMTIEKVFEDVFDANQRRILHGRESSTGGRRQALELLKKIEHAKTIEEYGLEKSRKSAAELGIYAMKKTAEAKKLRPKDDVKPIMITLENIYPTMEGQDFGSHPEELMLLIDNARKEMASELISQKLVANEAEAKAKAKLHIGATLDTGHLNMWKKHFKKATPDETDEKTEERYKMWYLEQVDKLASKGYIGNVHLADNFGYDDAHVGPGQGNAPIKGVLEVLQKHGYNKKIQAEGGFNAGNQPGMYETWKMAGVSIHHKAQVATDAWVNPQNRFYNIDDSYHGYVTRPNFLFKGYAPESEHWQPWSGMTLE